VLRSPKCESITEDRIESILDAISYVFSQSWGVLHPYQ
jgi:hypothetical protein